MFKRLIPILAIAAVALMSATTVKAALTMFFGENQSPAQQVTGAPLVAKTSFLASAGGVVTENFEGFAFATTAPLPLVFTGVGGPFTATLTGLGQVDNRTFSGSFNTTGALAAPNPGKWWDVNGTFEITFDTPISAFGFYGTDIGDFDGRVTVALTDINNVVTNITIGNTSNGAGGSLLFWGLVDTANTYTKITFGNTSAAGGDFFGFDDMVVRFQPSGPTPNPEPATLALVGLSLVGLAVVRRRRN